MGRNLRTVIVLGVAVAAAAIASLVVYRTVQSLPVREVEIPRAHAVVAARALHAGTQLTASDLKLVAWPADSPVAGGFSDTAALEGRGLVAPMVANEPVTEEKLAPREAGAGLPPMIPEGMRAISVKVNEVIGVAGFVVPGTHVDVLATVANQRTSETVSRVIVSNVEVLAAGTKYDQDASKSGEPIETTVVTLKVTPEDAERIALVSSDGRLMLALRHPLDEKLTETTGVRLASLMGPPPAAPQARPARGRTAAAATPPPPPEPVPYTVETIRAAKRTEEVLSETPRP